MYRIATVLFLISQLANGQAKVEHIENVYKLGDINNDKISDTAIVSFDVIEGEDECAKPDCTVNVTFSYGLPALDFMYSKGIFVTDAGNMDGRPGNEVLMFSRTNEGWWNILYLYTLREGSWVEIATCKAFCAEDRDFENRIFTQKGKAYLIADHYDVKSATIKKKNIYIKR